MTRGWACTGDSIGTHREKMRFLVVGAFNAGFGYLLFLLAFTLFGGPIELMTGLDTKTVAIILQWTTWVLAVIQATATMKYLVFKSRGRFWPQVGRAYLVYLPAQILAAVTLYCSLRFLGLSVPVGQVLAVVVTTVFSYFGHKRFTFKSPVGRW